MEMKLRGNGRCYKRLPACTLSGSLIFIPKKTDLHFLFASSKIGQFIWLAEEMVNLGNTDFSARLMGPKAGHKIAKCGRNLHLARNLCVKNALIFWTKIANARSDLISLRAH